MFLLLKQGRVPAWRLALWAIVAMAGVGYFIRGESPRMFWGCVLMTGAMIVGFAYWLYWAQSSQWLRGTSYWLEARIKWSRRKTVWLMALCMTAGFLVELLEHLWKK